MISLETTPELEQLARILMVPPQLWAEYTRACVDVRNHEQREAVYRRYNPYFNRLLLFALSPQPDYSAFREFVRENSGSYVPEHTYVENLPDVTIDYIFRRVREARLMAYLEDAAKRKPKTILTASSK